MTIKQHGGVFGRNPAFNDVSVETLSIAGTALSSTAAELNILDGVTATTAELNILDGVTATTAELNILDGVTADATELNYLDGTSTSVVTASKAVLANASANIAFASGKGIDFSATSGTGTSELFDDYEEGTWTPLLDVQSGTAPTYTADYGYYTKVGNMVFATAAVNITAAGSGLLRTTYPFTPANSLALYGVGKLFDSSSKYRVIVASGYNTARAIFQYENNSAYYIDANTLGAGKFAYQLIYMAA